MAEIVENCPESPKGMCTGECLPKGYHEEDVIELHPTENISEELIMSNSPLDSSTETKPDSGIEGTFFNSYKTFISENNCCKISIQKRRLDSGSICDNINIIENFLSYLTQVQKSSLLT